MRGQVRLRHCLTSSGFCSLAFWQASGKKNQVDAAIAPNGRVIGNLELLQHDLSDSFGCP